ncbi:MAG: molybdopterin-binding protein [Caldilineaceae bacterium]
MIIRAAILSIPQYDDEAISVVQELLQVACSGLFVVRMESVNSQRYWLEEVLRRWCDEEEVDLIVTIGGTMPAPGPSTAEVVPEATAAIIERPLPGFSEAMRQFASQETLLAYLDRGVAGIRGRTLIVNLPAGAAPAYLFLEAVAELLAPTIHYLNDSSTAPALADRLQLEKAQRDVGENQPLELPAATASHEAQLERDAHKTLDPAEFAAFLQRNHPRTQRGNE